MTDNILCAICVLMFVIVPGSLMIFGLVAILGVLV